MLAELATIEQQGERRRFALGCAWSSLRPAVRRTPWLIAIGTGAVIATITLIVSRVSLGGGRGGIMAFTLLWPAAGLFAVALVTARVTRSFRTGLLAGVLATLVSLVGMLLVAVPEAALWHDLAGVYLMDGDLPKGGLERLNAILDPVSPSFVFLHLVIWCPWPVLGSWLGSRRHGREVVRLSSVGQRG